MYKVEIVAGLKNTIDRGYTLEQAIQSFINAGYSKEDVLEAAEQLRGEPTLSMQVTPPEEFERKKSRPEENRKPGFFQRLHLPHIHFAALEKPKKHAEQIQLPSEPEIEKRSEARKTPGLEVAPFKIQKMQPEEKSRIRRIEIELRTKKRWPEKEFILKKPMESTAILELPKVAARKVKMERKEITLENIKVPQIVKKHEIRLPQETTDVLGLPKTPRRKSDNIIFVILIILLVMLLGALLFSFFYREKLLEIIKQLLEK